MDGELKLNNGEVLQGYLVETKTRLFLYLYGLTLAEVFNLLIDPENTKKIHWKRYGQEGDARGYNHLLSVTEEINGIVSASLKKG